MKVFGCVVIFLLVSMISLAQGSRVDGTITNESGAPLVGVTIFCSEEIDGTISDINGVFSLKTDCQDLLISMVGYYDQTIKVAKNPLRIILEVNPNVTARILLVIEKTPPLLSKTKIDHALIDFSSEPNISTALNTVAGVHMHSGVLNTNRITIRGIGNRSQFSTTKLRAYVDDIPITNGVGESSIEDIDLSLLNSVVVWKGPSASLFGAGLGGVIEMKTKIKDGFSPSSVSTRNVFGEWGLWSTTNQVNYRTKDETLNLHFLQGFHQSDGYRENNNYERQNYSLLGQKVGTKSNLSVLFNHIRLNAQIPSSLNEDDYLNNPEKAAFTWSNVEGFEDYTKTNIGLTYSNNFKYGWNWVAAGFVNLYDSYESRPFNIIDDQSTAYGFRSRLEYEGTGKFKTWNAQVGTEVYRENYQWELFETNDGVQGDLFNDNQENRNYFNLFGEISWAPREKLELQFGLNANRTSYSLTDEFDADGIDISGERKFDFILSPRLSGVYRWSQQLNSRFIISHGFSNPNSEETLTPDGLINTDLNQEQGWNYELGFDGKLLSDRLRYSASFYSMHIKDLLVSERLDNDQYIGLNAGRTRHDGFEFSLEHELYKDQEKGIKYQVAYTYADYSFTEFINDDEDHSGNELTGTSPHVLNGFIYSNFQNLYARLMYRYQGAMPLRDDNSIYSEAFQKLDFQIGFKMKFMDRLYGDVYFGINNVLDEKYAAMHLINASSFGGSAPRYYYPGQARNTFVGMKLSYSFED